jgi:hypothetical protein
MGLLLYSQMKQTGCRGWQIFQHLLAVHEGLFLAPQDDCLIQLFPIQTVMIKIDS